MCIRDSDGTTHVACTGNLCQEFDYKYCIMTENPCATDHIPVDVTSEGAFCLPVDSCGTGTHRKLGGTSVMQLGTYVNRFNPSFDDDDPTDAGSYSEPSCPPGYSNLSPGDCYMILNYAVTRNLQNAGFDNYSVINSQTYTVPLQQDIYVEVFDLDNTSTRQNILTLFPDWAPHINVTSEWKSTIIPPTCSRNFMNKSYNFCGKKTDEFGIEGHLKVNHTKPEAVSSLTITDDTSVILNDIHMMEHSYVEIGGKRISTGNDLSATPGTCYIQSKNLFTPPSNPLFDWDAALTYRCLYWEEFRTSLQRLNESSESVAAFTRNFSMQVYKSLVYKNSFSGTSTQFIDCCENMTVVDGPFPTCMDEDHLVQWCPNDLLQKERCVEPYTLNKNVHSATLITKNSACQEAADYYNVRLLLYTLYPYAPSDFTPYCVFTQAALPDGPGIFSSIYNGNVHYFNPTYKGRDFIWMNEAPVGGTHAGYKVYRTGLPMPQQRRRREESHTLIRGGSSPSVIHHNQKDKVALTISQPSVPTLHRFKNLLKVVGKIEVNNCSGNIHFPVLTCHDGISCVCDCDPHLAALPSCFPVKPRHTGVVVVSILALLLVPISIYLVYYT